MRDSGDLVKAIKKMANDSIENEKPTRIMYGKVVSANPLKVNVEQRMELDKNFLVLTDHLTRKTAKTTVRDYYRNTAGELIYTNRDVEIVLDNRLKVGDKVLLLREQGGQKFVILDKVVSV